MIPIVGIGAGLVSALLFSVVITGSPLAALLYSAAPLPIFLAPSPSHTAPAPGGTASAGGRSCQGSAPVRVAVEVRDSVDTLDR